MKCKICNKTFGEHKDLEHKPYTHFFLKQKPKDLKELKEMANEWLSENNSGQNQKIYYGMEIITNLIEKSKL